MKRFLVSLTFLGQALVASAASPNAETILKEADEVRNPAQSYLMKVQVKDSEDAATYEYDVSIRGRDKTHILTTAPKREEGKIFLMLGEDMWVFIPNLKRAVRVSLNQRLVGEAANGDIGRMRWFGDYKSRIEKEINEGWVLFLEANKKGLTYEKIRLWVSKDGYKPVKAEFLTASGKVFKRAAYKGYRQLAGRVRPTQIEISNATTKAKSIITILDAKAKTFSDSLFKQDSLR